MAMVVRANIYSRRWMIVDMVRDAFSERVENGLHPALEIPHVLLVVALVPLNRVLLNCGELDSLLSHACGHLLAAENVGLADSVMVDRVAAPAYLFAMFSSMDLVANPPDVGARNFLKDAALFELDLPGHVVLFRGS
jgi:hypothetical protein